jgi:hypothetical protein
MLLQNLTELKRSLISFKYYKINYDGYSDIIVTATTNSEPTKVITIT